MAKKDEGATVTVKGREYNINKDFTWRELMTVEELAGVPLARDGAFDAMATGAALIFVILKREEKQLTWETFLDGSIADIEAPAENGNGNGSGKRPTRAAKAASSPA